MKTFGKIILVLALGFIIPALMMTAPSYAASKTKKTSSINQQLMDAAELGNIAMAKKLLKRGANPNFMMKNGRPSNFGGVSILTTAAHEGNMPMVKLLMAHGAKVNPPGADADYTPLAAAAGNGDYDMVVLFINAGANVAGPAGNQALTLALSNIQGRTGKQKTNYEKTIKLLKQHGARR